MQLISLHYIPDQSRDLLMFCLSNPDHAVFAVLASKDHQSDHVVGPTLQGMPAEIRDVIFEVIFTDHWQGKTHPLIIALRGDQEMYQHAIVVYENVNAFRLGPKNDWLCFKSPIYKTLSITPLHHIRHLVVDMPQILRQ